MKPGEVVKLKSGSYRMAVVRTNGNKTVVAYQKCGSFGENQGVMQIELPTAILRRVRRLW